jgi:hypothetical protein
MRISSKKGWRVRKGSKNFLHLRDLCFFESVAVNRGIFDDGKMGESVVKLEASVKRGLVYKSVNVDWAENGTDGRDEISRYIAP